MWENQESLKKNTCMNILDLNDEILLMKINLVST